MQRANVNNNSKMKLGSYLQEITRTHMNAGNEIGLKTLLLVWTGA